MSSYIKFMFNYLFQQQQPLDEVGELDLRDQQLLVNGSSANSSSGRLAASLAASVAGSSLAPDKRSRCLSLARALLVENRAATSALRSFAEFERLAHNSSFLLRQRQPINSNHPAAQAEAANSNSFPSAFQQQQLYWQPTSSASQLELLECYNQLQLRDYYSSYDIFIGMRIAYTLTILFVVFILFVIYKTGCHEGQASRSQFSTTSGASKKTYAKNRKTSAANVGAGRRRQQRRRYQKQQQQLAEPAMLSRQSLSASQNAPLPPQPPPAACQKPPEAPPPMPA